MILCMSRTTLRARGQLTLPEEIREAARLEEGDLLDAEITPDGILLRPRKVIDATQAWFWDAAWQEGEQAADADRRAGRVETFSSGDELLSALTALAKPARRRRAR
jgi:AbrB family looped-hinge helix DNA binding protein